MREIVGFVMGAAAGAAGALFATSTEGRALLERLKDEARPETERATTEWEPVLREVSRAVRLAVRELETATVDLRARIGEIAREPCPTTRWPSRFRRSIPRRPRAPRLPSSGPASSRPRPSTRRRPPSTQPRPPSTRPSTQPASAT